MGCRSSGYGGPHAADRMASGYRGMAMCNLRCACGPLLEVPKSGDALSHPRRFDDRPRGCGPEYTALPKCLKRSLDTCCDITLMSVSASVGQLQKRITKNVELSNSAHRNQQWAGSVGYVKSLLTAEPFQDGTSITARVVSVSFFQRANGLNDLAQVRYIKVRRTHDGAEGVSNSWIATLQYAYSEPSKDPRVRQWNPLGFRILEFRPEPETSTDIHQAPPNTTGSPR